ncbi:MAG: response regulator [Candidatus Falkowbacteria bacterium]|nr:response regulator [Candidatus Falkowbacteria bacterium]
MEKKKIILVVEDTAEYQRILSVKLAQFGYEVLSAHDGEEGLAMALEHHPDLILLDIVMPKMDGLAMLEKLREDSWGKDVRVIMLTNLSGTEKIADAMLHNSFEYIVKTDTTIEDLVKKIQESL